MRELTGPGEEAPTHNFEEELVLTEEENLKLLLLLGRSRAARGRKPKGIAAKNRVKVLNVDTGEVYPSQLACSEALGIELTKIRRILKFPEKYKGIRLRRI